MSILECKALTKSYGAREALRSVDLTIEPGHIVRSTLLSASLAP